MDDRSVMNLKSSDRLKQEIDNEQGLILFKFQQTVEDFDNESEDDLGISVTISRSIAGGREGIESHWKIYATEDLGESWNVKAICIDSEDSRYQPEDEVQFEIYKEDDVWDIESSLKNTIEEEGF